MLFSNVEQECTIEGQVYTDCAPPSDCHATCSDPFKVCPRVCTQDCVCPESTVIDEIKNKCVPQSQCSKFMHIIMFAHMYLLIYLIFSACPPQCSYQYCALAEEGDFNLLPCMR